MTQLDKKKAALAVARADAKEAASGAIKLDPRDIALSNAKKADILTPALAAAGAHTPARLGSTSTSYTHTYTHTRFSCPGGEARAAEVRVLEREVEHVEQQLEQKSLEVHAAVIASQHEADLAEMTMLAGTLGTLNKTGVWQRTAPAQRLACSLTLLLCFTPHVRAQRIREVTVLLQLLAVVAVAVRAVVRVPVQVPVPVRGQPAMARWVTWTLMRTWSQTASGARRS